MKFKLDENLGPFVQRLFANKGHDSHSLREERLLGAQDKVVLAAAVSEGRVLVTLDRDFGNVLRFSPEATAGIIVLAPPGRVTRESLRMLVDGVLQALDTRVVYRKLWIVEPGRIREHVERNTEDT